MAQVTLDAALLAFFNSPETAGKDAEIVYKAAYEPICSLIKGRTIPQRPSSVTSSSLQAIPQIEAIVAVGIHGFHTQLPIGRMSQVYVKEDHLKRAIVKSLDTRIRDPVYSVNDPAAKATKAAIADVRASMNKDTPECNWLPMFLELFSYCYSNLYGRQETLIHTLLEKTDNAGEVFTITAGQNAVLSKTKGTTHLDLTPFWPLFTDDAVLDKLTTASALEAHSERRSELAHELSPEGQSLIGDRLLARIDDPKKNPSAATYCIRHGLESLLQALAVALRSKPPRELLTLLHQVEAKSVPDSHTHTVEGHLLQIGRMLQLFLLYREFCGRYFYVVIPPGQQSNIPMDSGCFRMCFTFGSQRELTPDECSRLQEISTVVARCVETTTHRAASSSDTRKVDAIALWAEVLGGPTLTALKAKASSLVPGGPALLSLIPGVSYYLRFAERLAREAVHEGKRLNFALVVGDGGFASRKLKIHSGLPSPDQRQDQGAAPTGRASGHWGIYDDVSLSATISLCRGNYAFLQRSGVVLYGNHDGDILRLAGLLTPDVPLAEITKDQHTSAVIRLTEKANVELYWGGSLILTTHAGRFVVPRRYGSEYVNGLTKHLQDVFPHSDKAALGLLADAVWRFSQKGKGTCFVVGTWEDDLENVTSEMTKVLPFAEGLPLLQPGSVSRLDDLAEQDGAVVVDASNTFVFGRRQLIPYVRAAKSIRDDRATRPKLYRWGTRHQSAYAFMVGRRGQENALPAIAIVVSTDGDIHVMDAEGIADDYTYPTRDSQDT